MTGVWYPLSGISHHHPHQLLLLLALLAVNGVLLLCVVCVRGSVWPLPPCQLIPASYTDTHTDITHTHTHNHTHTDIIVCAGFLCVKPLS